MTLILLSAVIRREAKILKSFHWHLFCLLTFGGDGAQDACSDYLN